MHLKGIFWVFLVFCLKYKCLAQIEVITGANLSQAWDEYLQEHTELLTLSSDLLADRKLIFDENMQNILTNNNDPATLFFMAPNNCTHLIFEECAVYYLGLDMTIPEPNQDTSNSSDTSSTTSSAPAADTATSSSTSSSSTTTTSSRAKDVAAKLLNEVREHQKAQKKLNKQKQKQQQQKQPKTHQTGHSKAATTTSSSSSSNGGLSDIAKGNRKQLKDYAHQERQEKHAHDNIIIKKGPNGERVSVTWSPGLRASPIDSTTPIPSFTDVNELKSSCSVDCIHGDYSTTFFTTEPITTTHWTTMTEPTTTTTLTSTIPTTTVPKSSTTQSTSASTSTATSPTTASTTESTSTSTKTTTTPTTTTTTTSPTTTSTTSTTTIKIPTTVTPATTTTTTSAATTTYSTTVFSSTVSSKDYNTSWADLGFCGPVRYQGACGSCWAFATAGAIECAYMIKNNLKNKPIVLSVQQFLDCTYGNVTDPYGNKYGNDGCYGGGLFNTFVYSRYNKIVTDASYPFVDGGAFDNTTATSKYNLKLKSVTCGANSNYAVTGITNLISLPVLNETSILEAVNLQPVAAAMQVTNNFVYYKTGIFTDSTCATTVNTCYSSVNHAVIIVGYGSLNGVDYWILKNEWGTWWGENGFMRMKRGANMCCITTDSYVPLL